MAVFCRASARPFCARLRGCSDSLTRACRSLPTPGKRRAGFQPWPVLIAARRIAGHSADRSPPRTADGENRHGNNAQGDHSRGGPQVMNGSAGREEEAQQEPNDQWGILRPWLWHRLLVNERGRGKRQNEQRRDRPAKEVDPGRGVPVELELRRVPEPIVLYVGGEGLQADIQQHHEQGGDSDQSKAVVLSFAPGPQYQPRDAAGSKQDRNRKSVV